MTAPSLGLDWLHSYVSSDGAEARAENERRSRPVRIGPLIFAAAHPQRNAERVVEIWRCSSCGHIDWDENPHGLRCSNCNHELSVTERGIVLN